MGTIVVDPGKKPLSQEAESLFLDKLFDVCVRVGLLGDRDRLKRIRESCSDGASDKTSHACDRHLAVLVHLRTERVLVLAHDTLINGELESDKGTVSAKEGQRALVEGSEAVLLQLCPEGMR